jgi:hypothetical protein
MMILFQFLVALLALLAAGTIAQYFGKYSGCGNIGRYGGGYGRGRGHGGHHG